MPRRRSWNEKYNTALREAQKIGAAKAEGPAAIASFCSLLQHRIGAVAPVLIFEGAMKRNIPYDKLRKMTDQELIDLQWELA